MTEERVTDPVTGGQKGRKPERFDLFPFDALEEVARVYGMGAGKYEDDNWLKGYSWRLSAGALMRHVARFMLGEDRDPESGLLHLAHAAWHCLTLITFTLRGKGTDDRAKVSPTAPNALPFYIGQKFFRRDKPERRCVIVSITPNGDYELAWNNGAVGFWREEDIRIELVLLP